MNNIVDKIKNKSDLVAIYANNSDGDKFAVGYILNNTDEEIIMLNINPYGKYDGMSAFLVDDIFRVEYESLYLNKIDRLIEKNFDFPVIEYNEGIFDGLLKYSKNNNKIVMIKIGNSYEYITGIISEIEKEFISLKQVDQYGIYDGSVIIKKSEISCVVSDDEDCRSIRKILEQQII